MTEREHYVRKARYLVETNAAQHPELLIDQLATAMLEGGRAVTAAARMRNLAGVCLRLADRAGVQPKGDEQIAVNLAREVTHCSPARNGGNGWLDEDQLRIDLQDAA